MWRRAEPTKSGSERCPRWIINFPTKQHWRGGSRLEWIETGLGDLRRVILDREIQSIAIPPLGCGQGGLEWSQVRPLIERDLGELGDVDVLVFEPAFEYQNVAKRNGVKGLTPARAMIAEMVRRYWILGIECSLLEIQKLAFFLEREIIEMNLDNPLDLRFQAQRYGPYADRLRHLLDGLDGSYLRSRVRIADARPTDVIAFNDDEKQRVHVYLQTSAREYLPALDGTSQRIAGFESPLGMELLATIDWLLVRERVEPEIASIKVALKEWPGGKDAGDRKLALFDDRMIGLALERLSSKVEARASTQP